MRVQFVRPRSPCQKPDRPDSAAQGKALARKQKPPMPASYKQGCRRYVSPKRIDATVRRCCAARTSRRTMCKWRHAAVRRSATRLRAAASRPRVNLARRCVNQTLSTSATCPVQGIRRLLVARVTAIRRSLAATCAKHHRCAVMATCCLYATRMETGPQVVRARWRGRMMLIAVFRSAMRAPTNVAAATSQTARAATPGVPRQGAARTDPVSCRPQPISGLAQGSARYALRSDTTEQAPGQRASPSCAPMERRSPGLSIVEVEHARRR